MLRWDWIHSYGDVPMNDFQTNEPDSLRKSLHNLCKYDVPFQDDMDCIIHYAACVGLGFRILATIGLRIIGRLGDIETKLDELISEKESSQ